MKRLRLFDYIFTSGIILGGILIDQLTKWLAVSYLKPITTLPIIKDVLHLTYHTNRGMAFGLLEDSRWLFISVSIITIVALSIWLYSGRMQNKLYTVSVAMIISGGVGNMIDRLLLGAVIDFIDFRLINFAIFNGADSFVCIGAGLLILALIIDIIKEAKTKKQDSEP